MTVQARVAECLIEVLRKENFNESEICFALALVSCESGFNPDAAAGSTSASGIGQFTDDTRRGICRQAGISAADPFSTEMNVRCLAIHLRDCLRFAQKKGKTPGTRDYFVMAYAYYHDGPSLRYGGSSVARSKVLPQMDVVRACLRK